MVWVNITLHNNTPWLVDETGLGSIGAFGTREGTLSCRPGSCSECKLRPETGFLGVEKGIEYRFTLTCGSSATEVMTVWLCFPVVGSNKYDLSKITRGYARARACARARAPRSTFAVCRPGGATVDIPTVHAELKYLGKGGLDNAYMLDVRLVKYESDYGLFTSQGTTPNEPSRSRAPKLEPSTSPHNTHELRSKILMASGAGRTLCEYLDHYINGTTLSLTPSTLTVVQHDKPWPHVTDQSELFVLKPVVLDGLCNGSTFCIEASASMRKGPGKLTTPKAMGEDSFILSVVKLPDATLLPFVATLDGGGGHQLAQYGQQRLTEVQCLDVVLGCSAGMQCWDAVLGCSARLQCWDAVQGCSAGMQCGATVLGCSPGI